MIFTEIPLKGSFTQSESEPENEFILLIFVNITLPIGKGFRVVHPVLYTKQGRWCTLPAQRAFDNDFVTPAIK